MIVLVLASIAISVFAVPGFYTSGAVANPNSPQTCVVHVKIINYAYYPEKVKVAPGCTVTWTNKDISIHTVTSVTKVFHSKIMEPGNTFSYTFNAKGIFGYFCEIHNFMMGEVVVS